MNASLETTRQRPTVPIALPHRGAVHFLYRTLPGRACLKVLSARPVSKMAGRFLDSRLSARMIPGFIRKHQLDLSEYQDEVYRSYNAFFTRRIRPVCRPVDDTPAHLISPCDAKLSAFPIQDDSVFWIKDSPYRLTDLLGGDPISASFAGGLCLIFRLEVDNYHRYCYIDDGQKGDNVFLPGVLHTVQPIALERYNIYKRNCREYTVIDTAHFGRIVQMEVGALMVGRICNHHGAAVVRRGQEKGFFQFGGSTVVLLLPPGAATLDPELLENSRHHLETIVKYGEAIGRSDQNAEPA